MMRRYAITGIILAVLASVLIALADENAVHQRISQTSSGYIKEDGSIITQDAGLGGVIIGIGNSLSQSIDQDASYNKGTFLQQANLSTIITGNNNSVTQSASQKAIDNVINGIFSSNPIQKINAMAIVVGDNNSPVSQSINQTARDNTITDSTFRQIASEATTVVSRNNTVTQEISQDLINQTLNNSAIINQTAMATSTVI